MEALAAEDARGKRLVLSSPIGESSVTIRNVQHVIDCCRTNQVYWSRTCNEYLSRIEWVSQSQAMQRRGRTGRTCHGTVWRLVPARTYHGFETFETSALRMQSQRKECLLLSCAQDRQLQDAAAFLECCLDAPRDEVVTDALQKLCQSAPQSAPALPALPLLASSS
jgi:HrpA-like RNA helicase